MLMFVCGISHMRTFRIKHFDGVKTKPSSFKDESERKKKKINQDFFFLLPTRTNRSHKLQPVLTFCSVLRVTARSFNL